MSAAPGYREQVDEMQARLNEAYDECRSLRYGTPEWQRADSAARRIRRALRDFEAESKRSAS